jgi:hypothetical protein
MPIIESQSQTLQQAELAAVVSMTAAATVSQHLRATLQCSSSIAAELAVTKAGAATIASTTTIYANGRLAGDPTTFGSGDLQCSAALQATLSGPVYASAALDCSVGLSANANLILGGLAVINATVSLVGHADIQTPEQFELRLIVDLLPTSGSGQVRELAARLTVDGVVVPMAGFTYTRLRSRIDDQLQATLADIADRTRITRNSQITFELGEKISGTWQWRTMMNSGYSNSSNYSVEQKGDTFTFVGLSPMRQKLNKTAEKNWVIYDPTRVTLTAADFDLIYDSDGRSYETTLTPVAGLNVEDLLDLIFRQTAGFSAVKTNLPAKQIRITRLDIRAGDALIKGIASEIGMYAPDFDDLGGTLWIRDTTSRYPSGWPAPQTVAISRSKQLAIDTEHSRVDALEMTYSEYKDAYDYVAYRVLDDVQTVDNAGVQVTTTTTTTYIDYYRNSNPFRPVNTERAQVHTVIQDAFGWVIEDSTENFYYFLSSGDYYNKGDLGWRTKVVNQTVPVLSGDHHPLLQTVQTEDEKFFWRGHPFELDKKFRYRRLLTIKGLIAVDSENQQLGKDYKRALTAVYDSGNLTESMTIEEGAIKTVDEWVVPLSREDVRINVTEIDHLSNRTTRSTTEERVGDIGRSALVNVQRTMYVFPDNTFSRTTDRIETFNAGPLPPTLGVPLARRVLDNRKNKPQKFQLEVAGFDNAFSKGVPVAPTGRAAADLGIFEIDDIVVTGSDQGFVTQLRGDEAVAAGAPTTVLPSVQPGGSGYFAIYSNDQKVLPVNVECHSGLFLRCDVVPNLVVEARKQGDSTWVDIEAAGLDLTAYDGTIQIFEIRLTLGTITAQDRAAFRIYVS